MGALQQQQQLQQAPCCCNLHDKVAVRDAAIASFLMLPKDPASTSAQVGGHVSRLWPLAETIQAALQHLLPEQACFGVARPAQRVPTASEAAT